MELSGCTVVVAGSSGFLGCNVVEALEARGARVVGVLHRDYDLRRRADIERLLDQVRPDALVHLAAVVGGIGANPDLLTQWVIDAGQGIVAGQRLAKEDEEPRAASRAVARS